VRALAHDIATPRMCGIRNRRTPDRVSRKQCAATSPPHGRIRLRTAGSDERVRDHRHHTSWIARCSCAEAMTLDRNRTWAIGNAS